MTRLTDDEDRRCLARLAVVFAAAAVLAFALAISAIGEREPACGFGSRSVPSAACGNMELAR